MLNADGDAHVNAATLALHATDVPNGPGLLLQGSALAGGGSGVTFGEGLLCVSGTIVSLGVVFAANNTSDYPGDTAPVPISIAGSCTPGVDVSRLPGEHALLERSRRRRDWRVAVLVRDGPRILRTTKPSVRNAISLRLRSD